MAKQKAKIKDAFIFFIGTVQEPGVGEQKKGVE